jgi:hypothetical protein
MTPTTSIEHTVTKQWSIMAGVVEWFLGYEGLK